MSSAWRVVRPILLAMLVLALIATTGFVMFINSGCSSTVEGLRFAPGEEQKQAAQTARDTARGGALVGIPPGSDAAKMLADSTGPGAAYIGEPKKPVDVMPALVTASKEWRVMEGQLSALKMKGRISSEVSIACKTALADLMARLAEAKKAVKPTEVLPVAQAIVTMEGIGRKMVDAVEVPEVELTDAEKASSAQVKALTETLSAIASQVASRPVTAGDVGDAAVNAATNAADKASGWLDQIASSPAASSILTALGLGGLGGGVLLRNKAKKRTVEDAEYDAQLAAAQAKADTLSQTAQAKPDPTGTLLATMVTALVGRQATPSTSPTAAPPAAPSPEPEQSVSPASA